MIYFSRSRIEGHTAASLCQCVSFCHLYVCGGLCLCGVWVSTFVCVCVFVGWGSVCVCVFVCVRDTFVRIASCFSFTPWCTQTQDTHLTHTQTNISIRITTPLCAHALIEKTNISSIIKCSAGCCGLTHAWYTGRRVQKRFWAPNRRSGSFRK